MIDKDGGYKTGRYGGEHGPEGPIRIWDQYGRVVADLPVGHEEEATLMVQALNSGSGVKRTRYEYKIVAANRIPFAELLTHYGLDGWHMVKEYGGVKHEALLEREVIDA